jgi:hypothetical protein
MIVALRFRNPDETGVATMNLSYMMHFSPSCKAAVAAFAHHSEPFASVRFGRIRAAQIIGRYSFLTGLFFLPTFSVESPAKLES